MKPSRTNPETNTTNPTTPPVPPPTRLHSDTQNHRRLKPPQQQTMWNFVTSMTQPPETPNIPEPPQNTDNNTQQSDNSAILLSEPATPVATPTGPPKPNSVPPSHTQETPTIQQALFTPPSYNVPWGDTWVVTKPSSSFRIVSKNTGTISLQNLDMIAITQELQNLAVSVFAGQETNVHWDPATHYQMYTQCRRVTPHIKIATSTSQEPAADWYKPGGTMLLTLDPWTSRVIDRGTDSTLGRWSYMEFVGKQNKRVIVVSGYRVCNQKFDATSNTTTAQQMRLLQQQGQANPNPCNEFLTDLIQLINQWRMAQK